MSTGLALAVFGLLGLALLFLLPRWPWGGRVALLLLAALSVIGGVVASDPVARAIYFAAALLIASRGFRSGPPA